jgi:hypothetical protein
VFISRVLLGRFLPFLLLTKFFIYLASRMAHTMSPFLMTKNMGSSPQTSKSLR